MDPISLILAFAFKNPQATNTAINSYTTPGEVNVSQLNSSAADFAMQTLRCYHKTARFRDVDILGTSWKDQYKFGAENSVVMRINFMGTSGNYYQMIVAAMSKGQSYRTYVINEDTLIPYNKKCELETWTSS